MALKETDNLGGKAHIAELEKNKFDDTGRHNVYGAVQMVDENGDYYGVKNINNKPQMVSTPYYDEIAQGNIPNHVAVNKFGNNAGVSGAFESIAVQGGLYPWALIDAAPGLLSVQSTSAADVLAGTGASYATLYGQDLSGNPQSEQVALNGVTPVSTTLSFRRCWRIICMGPSTAGANVGTITVTAGGAIWAQVEIGDNQTLQTVWTVPLGKTFAMVQALFEIRGAKGGEGRIYARPPGELFLIKDVFHLSGGDPPHRYDLPLQFDSLTDIDCRGIADGTNYDIGARFSGYYE